MSNKKIKEIVEGSYDAIDIDIVICAYGFADVTKKCIESVMKYTDDPYRFILVNDASEDDGEVQRLFETIQKIKNSTIIIKHEKNLGFTRSANDGMKASSASLVMLLNNDIIITDKWQQRLYQIYNDRPYDGLIGPIGHTRLDNKKYKWAYKEDGNFGLGDITFVSGSRMIIRREVIDTIGHFDPEFSPGYYEDNDYSIRAKKRGFNLNRWVVPSENIDDKRSTTFDSVFQGNNKSMLLSKNRKYLFKKHREYLELGRTEE